MDEPENTNVFRYISKWGFGVYNWKLDDERKRLAWMSRYEVHVHASLELEFFIKHVQEGN